jgi:hypothetical protein
MAIEIEAVRYLILCGAKVLDQGIDFWETQVFLSMESVS